MKQKDMLKWMGKPVIVTKLLRRTYRENNIREWVSNTCHPIHGWVVGFRYLKNGVFVPATPMAYSLFVDDVAHLKVQSSIVSAEVVSWPTTKPFHVSLDGLRLAKEDEFKPVSPSAYVLQDASDLEMLKDIMSKWPRDSKGRWVKQD